MKLFGWKGAAPPRPVLSRAYGWGAWSGSSPRRRACAGDRFGAMAAVATDAPVMSGAGDGGAIGAAMQRRGEALANARAAGVRTQIADEADAMAGIAAHVEGEDVVLEGRGLLDRWIRDASLRAIGRTGGGFGGGAAA